MQMQVLQTDKDTVLILSCNMSSLGGNDQDFIWSVNFTTYCQKHWQYRKYVKDTKVKQKSFKIIPVENLRMIPLLLSK